MSDANLEFKIDVSWLIISVQDNSYNSYLTNLDTDQHNRMKQDFKTAMLA